MRQDAFICQYKRAKLELVQGRTRNERAVPLGSEYSALTPKAGTYLLLQFSPPLPSFWMD